MNVTDGDRERARELADLAYQSGYDQQFEPKPGDVTDEQVIDAIAAALAEERERARAPFLALADRLNLEAADQEAWDGNCIAAYEDIADLIRRAAEETE